MKTNHLIIALVVLVLIVLVSLNKLPFGLRFRREAFQDAVPPPSDQMVGVNPAVKPAPMMPKPTLAATPTPMVTTPSPAPMLNNTITPTMPAPAMPAPAAVAPSTPLAAATQMAANSPAPLVPPKVATFQNMSGNQGLKLNANKEGFSSYNTADQAGGAKDKYEPMGAFDGVTLPTGNNVSTWRYTAPNEELLGAPFELGDDSLFMFKNNQCKPECCGASFSCSGGCICTTKDQRQLIAGRGGNRTRPQED